MCWLSQATILTKNIYDAKRRKINNFLEYNTWDIFFLVQGVAVERKWINKHWGTNALIKYWNEFSTRKNCNLLTQRVAIT